MESSFGIRVDSSLAMLQTSSITLVWMIGGRIEVQLLLISPEFESTINASKLRACFKTAPNLLIPRANPLNDTSGTRIKQWKWFVFEEISRKIERKSLRKFLDLKIVIVLSEKQLGFLLYTSY